MKNYCRYTLLIAVILFIVALFFDNIQRPEPQGIAEVLLQAITGYTLLTFGVFSYLLQRIESSVGLKILLICLGGATFLLGGIFAISEVGTLISYAQNETPISEYLTFVTPKMAGGTICALLFVYLPFLLKTKQRTLAH